MARGERALVIYNNKFQDASGWINTSAAYSVDTGGAERELRQVSLAHGLRINTADDAFIIFRDAKSNLEFIRRGKDIGKRGMFVSLGAYQYHVFLDFRDVADGPDGRYAKLWHELDGRGVPSIDAALREMYLKPILGPLRDLLGQDAIKDSLALRGSKDAVKDKRMKAVAIKTMNAFDAIAEFSNSKADVKNILIATMNRLYSMLKFGKKGLIASKAPATYLSWYLEDIARKDMPVWRVLYSYVVLQDLGRLRQAGSDALDAGMTFNEWGLDAIVRDNFMALGADPGTAHNEALLLSLLLGRKHPDAMTTGFLDLVSDPKAQGFLSFNRYEGVLWFNKESFESLTWWLYAVSALNLLSDAKATKKEKEAKVADIHARAMELNEVAAAAGYKAETLLEMLRANADGKEVV